jgi:hypothetical protein
MMRSGSLHMQKAQKRAFYPLNQSAPKAEVTGSNPVGCATSCE